MVYEYKYVVVNYDGHSAAAWQQGSNAVIGLQASHQRAAIS
jgi:hypothetical protein